MFFGQIFTLKCFLVRFWQEKCFWSDYGREVVPSQIFTGKVFSVRFWQVKCLFGQISTGKVFFSQVLTVILWSDFGR